MDPPPARGGHCPLTHHVGLVTCSAFPGLTADDRRLLAPLRDAGVAADSVVWEDPYVEWSSFDLLIIRSTWDYAYRHQEFLRWVQAVAQQVDMWNPPPVLRANTHKGYLRNLERAGVHTVPTRYLDAGSTPALESLIGELSPATGIVVKPVVGNSGRWTIRVTPDVDAIEAGQTRIARILAHEEMMVQPYLPAIATSGEISVVAIDGEITHAVHKTPAAGEFRVQSEYGGAETAVAVSNDIGGMTNLALRTAGETLYARADFVNGTDGHPLLIELELVEPDLFLRHSSDAAQRLAGAVVRRL